MNHSTDSVLFIFPSALKISLGNAINLQIMDKIMMHQILHMEKINVWEQFSPFWHCLASSWLLLVPFWPYLSLPLLAFLWSLLATFGPFWPLLTPLGPFHVPLHPSPLLANKMTQFNLLSYGFSFNIKKQIDFIIESKLTEKILVNLPIVSGQV